MDNEYEQNTTQDCEFMSKIISLICDYSVDNGMSPTESIKTIGQNLTMLAEICTFDHWTKKNDKKADDANGKETDGTSNALSCTGSDISNCLDDNTICRNVSSNDSRFMCSKCLIWLEEFKEYAEEYEDDHFDEYYLDSHFKYCPNCGRKVIDT